MPQKYRVSTDNGVYEVTTEDAQSAPYVPDSPLLHGVNEQEGDQPSALRSALTPLAHPSSAGDFASLLLPNEAGASIMGRMVEPLAAGVKKYGGAAVDAATSMLPTRAMNGLRILGKLNPTEWNNPLTVAGREGRTTAASQAFNDLPLAQQMDKLPPTPAPMPARASQAPPIRDLGSEDLQNPRLADAVSTRTMPDTSAVPRVTDNPKWTAAPSPANSIDEFAKMMADKGGVTDTQAAQQVASRNVSGDWNSNLKPNFTAQDVVRLKLLMANGASEADAVKSVLSSRP